MKPSEQIQNRIKELIDQNSEVKEIIQKGNDDESSIAACVIAIQAIIDFLDKNHG